jgi:hypothetical protein
MAQTEQQQPVTVTCGANTQPLESLDGMTVGELRNRLEDVMNIPNPAQVVVGGCVVNNDYVVKAGDNVEFIKPAGIKG